MKKRLSKEDLRILPHDDEAEMAVLASVLGNNKSFDKVAEMVNAEDFYSPRNQHIFRIMGELNNEGQAIDVPLSLA